MSKQQTKVNDVYVFLMSELAKQHYVTGDRLVISQIASQCNTSEIPVREALRLLESDGYVKINANRGATVVGLTRETFRNIAEVKGVLEGYATRVCIDYLSPNDIRELRSINEQLHSAAQNNNYMLYSETNIRFHDAIYCHLPNADLRDLIKKTWQKWIFTSQLFSIIPKRMDSSYQEHLIILSLIEGKKYDETEQYVRRHIDNALSAWGDEFSS